MDKEFKYMIFSGGAINGLAYVGVLQVLEAAWPDMYERTQGYAGTSIGALVALLLCIGYTSTSMRAVIDTFNATVIFGQGGPMDITMGMLDPAKSLGPWVGGLIAQYMGRADVNFAELYRRTRQDITIVVTNLSRQRVEYFNRHTQPTTSVCTAVVASMALPLLFSPVVINGDLYVDGGLGDNFPVDVFPKHESLAVCIRLQSTPPWSNMVEYGMALLEVKSTLDRQGLPRKEPPARTITIPGSASIGLNFFLSTMHRARIMNLGIACALMWLLRWPLVLHHCCTMAGVHWL